MFGAKKDATSPKLTTTSALNSLVAGTVIIGDLSSKTDIRIDGKLEGNLRSEARVVVGENALIVGNIYCRSITIAGKIEGSIKAQEQLHIQKSGTVVGDITTGKLIIEDGALFNGASVMGQTNWNEAGASKQSNNKKKATVQEAN